MKSSRKKKSKAFGEKEFVGSLWKTMRKQERDSPAVGLLHEKMEGKIKLIGLTGGIASGKTTISRFFEEAGIPVIDADEIAREVVRPGQPAYKETIAAFGEGVLLPDKTLDRKKIAELVFADEKKRALLESITHPEILREILKRVQQFKKKKRPAVLIDAALLFESGLFQQMHKILLIRIDPKIQLKRLIQRDKLPEIQAWQRILAQMPGAQKEKLSDWIIDNSGTKEQTQKKVREVIKKI